MCLFLNAQDLNLTATQCFSLDICTKLSVSQLLDPLSALSDPLSVPEVVLTADRTYCDGDNIGLLFAGLGRKMNSESNTADDVQTARLYAVVLFFK